MTSLFKRKREPSGFPGFTEFFASNRIRSGLGALVLLPCFAALPAAVRANQKIPAPCKVIVVGYVGGLDVPNNPYSGIVQVRERLEKLKREGLCVETFSAYTWWRGYNWLMKRWNTGRATAAEGGGLERPRIIVYGHSLGGWATIELSRKLAARNIPVELTVQVDSVGLTDASVPPNVKQAVNYYRRAILPPYGRRKIRAQDSDATEILGNFRVAHTNHLSVTKAPQISDLIVSAALRAYSGAD
jgi:hypothetical protein